MFTMNRNFTLCLPLFPIVATRSPPHKTGFCVFTCLSCVGADQKFLFYEGARRTRKFGVPTVTVASRRPNIPLVRADFLCMWPAAEQIFRVNVPLSLHIEGRLS
jgi:hypothetical protein